MKTEITVAFDEVEAAVLSRVNSASILGGPEQDEKGPLPRLRLVRRATQGEPLRAVELAALKQALEESTAEREANVWAAEADENEELASAFRTWLPALADARSLVCQAEAVALGGRA